jgi:hypothetical protein
MANVEGLTDYRQQPGFEAEDLRSLGAIEGNVDKLVANRMCKRGMAWSLAGARRMARVLEANQNGVLENYLARRERPKAATRRLKKLLRWEQANHPIDSDDPEAWLRRSWATHGAGGNLGQFLRRIGRMDKVTATEIGAESGPAAYRNGTDSLEDFSLDSFGVQYRLESFNL